jgi:hypothetical protein
VRAACGILGRTPATPLDGLDELGLPTEAAERWAAWREGRDLQEPDALVRHIEATHGPLVAAVDALREAAAELHFATENRWRPIQRAIEDYCALARESERAAVQARRLKKAGDWLVSAEQSLRDARFEPIAARAQEVWDTLRQESSVQLGRVQLAGRGNKRKVSLTAAVDGDEAPAVAVMSQGELNALALSLFVPRATSEESPFRFVVIDDPVQSMDPHKVDGLATVLADIAKTRQVIVLTHDPRLMEAVRRMGVPARVIEVLRKPGSVVDTREARTPAGQYLADAHSLLFEEQAIGPRVVRRLIGGFCRQALEATFIQCARSRLLGDGASHAEVEERLAALPNGLGPIAALALCDNHHQQRLVQTRLKNWDSRFAAAYRAAQGGAHGDLEWTQGLDDLLYVTKRLVDRLEREF